MSRLFSTPPPTNQPCEAAGMQADRPGGNRIEQGRAIPIRTGVPGVDIGEHHRCYQIADASTRGPRILELFVTNDPGRRNRTLHAAKLAIAENAEHPSLADLPVITRTGGSKISVATLLVVEARNARTPPSHANAGIRIPNAAARTAENVETGPTRGWYHRGRFRIGGRRGQVGCNGRARERCKCGQRERKFLHFNSSTRGAIAPNPESPFRQL